ncbi:cancer-related nucleoside-triphosphatase [Rhizophagus clarus]|uniref:Cancer-related nucleoside-triphosphatase n=1 Tax=Rhizophagus clarus TaxID=94130 RepID=A0A8H3MDP0_9GLOM|nr:cancer-related nucleoside-triphosphatase [Rhizophagus clarus]
MPSLFLTGKPRIGKSTIIRKLVKYLQATYPETISTHGFYTSEVSDGPNKFRIGFDIITIDGQKGVLSRKKDYWTGSPFDNNAPRVGGYIVNLKEFERLAIPSITVHHNNEEEKFEKKKLDVIIIDEVGKMECFSNEFNEIVRNLVLKNNNVNNKSNDDIYVIGTVAMKHDGLAEEIRNKAGFGKISKEKILDKGNF